MQTITSKEFPLSPELLGQLEKGETLALASDDSVLAFIVPAVPAGQKRPFGLCAGEFTVPDDFNAPAPELEALIFGAESES